MRVLIRLCALITGLAIAASAFAQSGTTQVPPPPEAQRELYRSLGCFKDTSAYDLDGHLERSAQNTPQRCIAICKAKGFRYAAVQYGESCLCGNSYGKYGPADNCNMKCTGGPMACGGYSANEVYDAAN